MVWTDRDGSWLDNPNGVEQGTATIRLLSSPVSGAPTAGPKVDSRRNRPSLTEGEVIRLLDVARRQRSPSQTAPLMSVRGPLYKLLPTGPAEGRSSQVA